MNSGCLWLSGGRGGGCLGGGGVNVISFIYNCVEYSLFVASNCQ